MQVRLRSGRRHRERDVTCVKEPELPNAVGPRRTAGTAGVGPTVDALLEEESVHDELAAPVEQLGQRPLPVGALEAVVVLDLHHRHALAGGGELVHRRGHGLLALGDGRQDCVPFGLADDRRASRRHRLRGVPRMARPRNAPFARAPQPTQLGCRRSRLASVGGPAPRSEVAGGLRAEATVIIIRSCQRGRRGPAERRGLDRRCRHRDDRRRRWRLGGVAGASEARALEGGYVALGDSVQFGYSPFLEDPWVPARFVGYPELIGRLKDLSTTNLACPGQTAQAIFRARPWTTAASTPVGLLTTPASSCCTRTTAAPSSKPPSRRCSRADHRR